MQISAFHYAHHSLSLRPHARYPLDKFKKLVQAVSETFPNEVALRQGDQVARDALLLAHSEDYVSGIETGELPDAVWRGLGFIWSPELYPRSNCIVDCTYKACREALDSGIAFVLGGGAHHAFADVGRGFCVFNDLVLAPRMLQQEGLIASTLIFDCDVHQGDGTASICRGDNSITTCSIHSESNFPFKKERGDFDWGIPDTISDDEYLALVQSSILRVLDTRQFDILLYVAGADPYIEDRLGRLSISKDALFARDQFVFTQCFEREIPVAVVFGGGYCDPIERTVECNLGSVEASCRVFLSGHRKTSKTNEW